MRVLLLAQFPPPYHGASIMNKIVIETLQKVHTCEFINISLSNELESLGKYSFCKIIKFFQIFFRILYAFFTNKYDVVYVTIAPVGSPFYKDAIFVLLSKIFNKNILIHMHGKGIFGAKKNIFLKHLYIIVLKKCFIIHLSKSLIKEIDWICDKYFVVNNGINDFYKETIKDIDIIYFSNIIKEKGIFDLLRAINEVKKEYNYLKIVICGKFLDFETKYEFERMINDLNISSNITFYEGLYGEEKQQILNRSKIFVLPTYYANECFPLSILEAMSAHSLVITTNEGAITDIIQNNINGLIVKKQNYLDIANRITYSLKNDSESKKMINNSYNKFVNAYTLKTFEKNILNVFNKIIKRR